jgi:SAM-dependent methyltransferase
MTSAAPGQDIQHLRQELFEKLKALYFKQVQAGTIDYVKHHCNNDVMLLGQVDSFIKYYPHLKPGRVLDWGCLHGPDSAMLRMVGGPSTEIFGCDVSENKGFDVFRQFTEVKYTPLTHPFQLPFPDAHFDTVIGAGVIEHVANPRESLKELHRVIKDQGSLLLTYAPSKYSFTEFVLRAIKHPHHRRRFTIASLRSLLLDSGFVAQKIEFHAVTPTLSSVHFDKMRRSGLAQTTVDLLYKMNPFLEKFYPFNRLGQNIMVCARRVGFI